METKSCSKVAPRFSCENCYYFTSKKSSYDKHLLTAKHIKLTNGNSFSNKSCPKVAHPDIEFKCELCNKHFSSRVGIWKHKKKCSNDPPPLLNEPSTHHLLHEPSDKELIIMLIKDNSELKSMLAKVLENGTTNHNSNNTMNSHNKAFNLQFFLNETCKNAMNMSEFIDSIQLQLSDFMSMGEVGFVKGMTKIIEKNLSSLDETIRPIHCTDQKREVFYVKDENKWEKEEHDKIKLKNMISRLTYKNEKLMRSYKEAYPDYNNPESRRSDQYSKIMIESMNMDEVNREKIITNISKFTTISKKK